MVLGMHLVFAYPRRSRVAPSFGALVDWEVLMIVVLALGEIVDYQFRPSQPMYLFYRQSRS